MTSRVCTPTRRSGTTCRISKTWPQLCFFVSHAPKWLQTKPVLVSPLTRSEDDTAFIVPLHQLAKTLPEVPNKYTGKLAKLFVCQFEYIPSKLLEGLEHLGVLHTGEIPLIFNSASLWSYNEESIDSKTAMAVGRCWSSFAYVGSPGKLPFRNLSSSTS